MVKRGTFGGTVRRVAGLATALMLVAACSSGGKSSFSSVVAAAGEVPLADTSGKTLGIVAADEPRAALVARDIIERGGSVADAAAALYFTLAVTYPVAAGLGGGGVCLSYDPDSEVVTSTDFLPRASKAGGTLAVPGAVRGFAYLHARYGRLGWSELVSPGERLAALGHPMSRALARAVADHADTVRGSPFLSRLFVKEDGTLRGEGEEIVQLGLASTLGLVRGRGPLGFYSGPFAQDVVAASGARGGQITMADFLAYRPEEALAEPIEVRSRTIFSPARRTGAGVLSGEVLPAIEAGGGAKASPEALVQLATAAVQNALAQYGLGALPADFGSTGFVVADRDGHAMACGVTMTQPFGTASEPGHHGFAFAPAPTGAEGLAGAFLMPLLVTEGRGEDVLFAGVGAGGREAAAAVSTLAFVAAGGRAEEVEPVMAAIESGRANTVNALACEGGLVGRLRSCVISADPRAHGIAARGSESDAPDRGGRFFGLF